MMPLYYHNFFLVERNYEIFDIPEMVIDFFFMLSGFFLMATMRKLKDERILVGAGKMMLGRIKPMLFTLSFITVFNFIAFLVCIKSDRLHVLSELFKYWWFVLFLTLGVGIFYIFYRILKSERRFVIFLILVAVASAVVHYLVVYHGALIWRAVFVTRALGGISAGILVSYIPKYKVKSFNPAIPLIILLIPALFYLAYNDKTFGICILMIVMFGALLYFTSHISVSGRAFDFIGVLSVRIYLYMAFITMLWYMGIKNNAVLFVIDVAVALIDSLITLLVIKHRKKNLTKNACHS
jgi:hypothetical protein